MKRSEMLAIIEKQWKNSTSFPTDSLVAEYILAAIEKAGMLPPGYMKPIPTYEGKQYPLIPGDFKNEQGVWCTPGVNEWEQE